MIVNTSTDRFLAVAALALASGGIVCVTAFGTAAVVGGSMAAAAGLIALLAVGVLWPRLSVRRKL